METQRVVRFALLFSVALLLQPVVSPALAHSDEQHGGDTNETEEDSGIGFLLTPEREFAKQLNPSMDGPRIVWQERLPGDDETWDIMMANVSADNITAIPLTNTDHDEKRPVVEGDRVAWTVIPSDDPDNENLAVLDLSTGRIQHVPDTGQSEKHPTFDGDGNLYYTAEGEGGRMVFHGFDPDTGEVFFPIGKRAIVGEPTADEHWLAWAEGSPTNAKLHIKNLKTGNETKVKGLYKLEDGPELGPAGLAWIADYGGEFTRGKYTTLYNFTTGIKKFRTNVYPHRNLDHCETGPLWDQPGTSTTERSAIALRDRFVHGTILFGEGSFSGTCGADHVVYEQTVKGGDGREGVRQLYVVDLRDYRLPRDARITIDDSDRRRILRAPETLNGIAKARDTREPVTKVAASIDGGPAVGLNTTRTDEGLVWEAPIEPRELEPGRHELEIIAIDTLNRTTARTFTFYTETPYEVQLGPAEEPDVPREQPAPFPLNVLNHYQDYQPFYNTVFLVIAILVGLAWFAYRRYQQQPTGTPEYVPPDDVDI